jgi:hypothetical protein
MSAIAAAYARASEAQHAYAKPKFQNAKPKHSARREAKDFRNSPEFLALMDQAALIDARKAAGPQEQPRAIELRVPEKAPRVPRLPERDILARPSWPAIRTAAFATRGGHNDRTAEKLEAARLRAEAVWRAKETAYKAAHPDDPEAQAQARMTSQPRAKTPDKAFESMERIVAEAEARRRERYAAGVAVALPPIE